MNTISTHSPDRKIWTHIAGSELRPLIEARIKKLQSTPASEQAESPVHEMQILEFYLTKCNYMEVTIQVATLEKLK